MLNKYKSNKKASIFFYTLLLVNIALMIWVIVFNNSNIINNNVAFWTNVKEVFISLHDKWKIALESVRMYNSNWNWFVDWISCPESITMSWTTVKQDNIISDIVHENGSTYCLWTYDWYDFKIYFSEDNSDFSKIVYKWHSVNIIRSILTILDVLVTSRTYNSVIASDSMNLHEIELTMDGDDNTYYESDRKDNQFVEYNFVPPISIWRIVLKKPVHDNESSWFWNNWKISLLDNNGDEITYIWLSNIKKQSELEFDMKYLWLENLVKTVRITSDYWRIDISEFEIYELVSTWTEEIWEWEMDFVEIDLKKIIFGDLWIWWWDNIDDDYNSDNYRVTSIWDTYYPNWFQDDDVIPRKVIFWNINPWSVYENIFWTNEKTNEFIEKNINNDDILNMKAWDIDNAYMYLDLYNKDTNLFDIKILEFDRSVYQNDFSLLPIKSDNWNNISDLSWYIQLNSWELSFSNNITWNEYIFDFKNKDYWIFLLNETDWNMVYRLTAETDTWTWIYINPIDDSPIWTMEILSNNISLWWDRNFIWESYIITLPK